MSAADLLIRPLVVPLAGCIIAGGILAAAWHFSDQWLADHEAQYRVARAELIRAANQYRSASDDQAVYEEYAARFLELDERGWIGTEQRLSWIEALQHANRELKLPTLRYEIEQQQATTVGNTTIAPRLGLYRTPMSLIIGALHEGDVLELLDRLRSDGAGMMSVRQCSLRRVGEGPDVRVDLRRQNIDAVCELDWYTLRLEPER